MGQSSKIRKKIIAQFSHSLKTRTVPKAVLVLNYSRPNFYLTLISIYSFKNKDTHIFKLITELFLRRKFRIIFCYIRAGLSYITLRIFLVENTGYTIVFFIWKIQ